MSIRRSCSISRPAKAITALLLCVTTISGAAQIISGRPTPAQVVVHVESKGTQKVPDTLFGTFLEPIGNAINNGIAAEILVNRSLEDGLWNHVNLENMFREQPELISSSNETGIPLPWQSLNTTAGNRF